MPVSINILRCTTKAVIAAYLLITLASCAGEESAAKKALAQSLKDPDSAKFGDVRLIGKNGACIPVNAKNSFGGYSGWKAFMFVLQMCWPTTTLIPL
jgi:hypothetical protein